MSSLLDSINALIDKGVGDLSRLEHVKETIENNKKLYNSDLNYINDLVKKHLSSENEQTVTNEKNTQEPLTDSTVNSFCDNCGSALAHDSIFCNKCVENIQKSTQPKKSISDYSHSISDSTPITIPITIPRYDVIVPGIVLMILSSMVFFVPINDMGMSTVDVSNLCKGPLGLLAQAFGGENAVNACALINSIISMATIIGIVGLILTIVGIFTKKVVIINALDNKKAQSHSRYLTPDDDITFNKNDKKSKPESFCEKCGNKIYDNNSCMNCNQSTNSPTKHDGKEHHKGKIIGIVLGVIIFLFFVLAILSSN